MLPILRSPSLQGINCFDFNKNLNIIATGSTDHTVRLWNPYVESKPTALLKGHQTSILDVAIHESAGQVFSYSMDVVSGLPMREQLGGSDSCSVNLRDREWGFR